MATIDRDLVRAINSGNCFAIVGAGPSCELGLPSWKKQAEMIIGQLDATENRAVIEQCEGLLRDNQYPSVFSALEQVFALDGLVTKVAETLQSNRTNGSVYKSLAQWPFACYLTTNYDNYLLESLRQENEVFLVKQNSQDDFRSLRANSKGIIFKIHGDCSVPENIVMTEEQYQAVRNADEYRFWREKIRSVLHMVSVVIIGYSANDPDFQDQLQLAKDIASPDHPIFMFAAGFSTRDIRKYFQEFNIRIIPYNNYDGTHKDLRKVLKRYAPFIANRNARHLGQDPINTDKASIATAMHLYTKLNIENNNSSCLKKSYQALILSWLSESGIGKSFSLEELENGLSEKLNILHVDPANLHETLSFLHDLGLIVCNNTSYEITPAGIDRIESIQIEEQARRERFKESCYIFLKRDYSNLDNDQIGEIVQQTEIGLIRAFEKRGAEMAQAAFSATAVDLSIATDILDIVNQQSSSMDKIVERAAFSDLLLEIITNPDQVIKERFADLSQGYFSYHALGLDTECSDERLKIAQQKRWILDSSIILPLIAQCCENHAAALDIVERMKLFGLKMYTTGRLFDEVIEHANWAIRNFKSASPFSPELIQVAMGGPGYKQNLFIDGFIKWALKKSVPELRDYLLECIGEDFEDDIDSCISEQVKKLGIEIVEFSDWPDFEEIQWGDRNEIEEKISTLRKERATYRNEEQCRAEAEIFVLCEGGQAAFLSQSGILELIDRDLPRITWNPESIYRFLATFSITAPSDNLVYQTIMQDFSYSGFDIVNQNTLREYFSGTIRQALMSLDEEKERYESAIGSEEYRRIRNNINNVTDTQKPFYSIQFAHYVALREIRKRELAEERANRIETVKALTEKERAEYEKLKAKEAERKQLQKQKERKSQSKKKGKKKKK